MRTDKTEGLHLSPRAANLVAVGFALVFLLIYSYYTQSVFEGWDPIAYLYAGEQLAQGESFAFCHPHNSTVGPYFTLAGFNVRGAQPDCLYLNYPPGFPLMLAAAARILSSNRIMFYMPALLGALGILLTYVLGRLLSGIVVALTSMVILAMTPLFLQFSTTLWSDLPVAVLLLLGVILFVWAHRHPASVYQVIGATAAALIVGWTVFSRYSSMVFLLPILLYLLVNDPKPSMLRSPAAWAFAVVVLMTFFGLGLFNRRFYGGFLSTPYSVEHGWYDWPKFSLRYALGDSPVGSNSLLAVLRSFWDNYGVLLLVGLMGVMTSSVSALALGLGFIGVIVAFYGVYAFPAAGINARFVLPAIPFTALLIGSGVWNGSKLFRNRSHLWLALNALLLVLEVILPFPRHLGRLGERNARAVNYVERVASAVASTEQDAVILAYNANDVTAYYGERLTFFYRRILTPDTWNGTPASYFEFELVDSVSQLLDRGFPVYYLLDANPPLMDSFSLLQQHFSLMPSESGIPLYRIVDDPRSQP